MDAFLSHFGIAQDQNKQGKPNWTIQVVVDGAESQTQTAHFDAQQRVWKLYEPAIGKPPCQPSNPTQNLVVQRREPTSPSPSPDTDWTDTLRPSTHSSFLLSLDWAATPLGLCRTWPRSLQLYTHMLLSDTRPGAIYWGPKRTAIYNESLIPLIGALHPTLMGRSFEEVIPSLWGFFGPIFQSIERDQHGFAQNGLELSVVRDGFLEETWWDGGLIPLRDDHGGHGGIYFSWMEVTRTVLQDRRTTLIHRLGQLSFKTIHSFWQQIYDVFTDFPRDITMAITYSVDENDSTHGRLHLEHTIGVGPGYTAAPSDLLLTLTNKDAPLAPLLLRAQNTPAEFIEIDLSKQAINTAILENVDWRGFGEPSQHLVIIPLKAKALTRGYIIMGLNPRRDFDADHRQFIEDLVRQLKAITTRVTIQQHIYEREDQLKAELSESERRISRMAEIVPVGIYELAADGALHWANDQFYEIMGVPHGSRDKSIFSWQDYILPDDHERANQEMGKSLVHGIVISDTLRLKRKYEPSGLNFNAPTTTEPFWIMYSASPYFNADGSVHSLTGSITDISHLKWAEQFQIRNADAARRERQIQEEFIDITSHEMRNPLSAITQSADGVLLSLQDAKNLDDVQSLMEIIKQNAEAAESILFCTAHQRRIIDDVLTLGKLDSKLLTIAPAPFHLEDLVDQTIQMFKTEFELNKIEVQTIFDGVPATEERSAVVGDASRLLQVLVNLMTNAIKFTRIRPLRTISIRFGSSPSIPTTNLFGQNFRWFSTGISRPDPTEDSDYGQGAPIYLYYAVTDSGKGIPSESLDKVFTKFEQADRRTHTEYGGSGLGLYISRELTEMQGGHIGIDSTVGAGSTFAFYVKVRCSSSNTLQKSSVVKQSHPLLETTRMSASLSLGSGPVSSPLLVSRNYSILLVEDNTLNQKVLTKQLRKAGCNVTLCNHGGEAVDVILQAHGRPAEYGTLPLKDTSSHFDCILMDWEMPICDGIQATKAIRNIELQQEVDRNLIIGVTANARAEQIARAIGSGMDSVVTKPFRVTELLARIDDLKIMNVS